jgi:GR25 family glycosyltransferase involved in LPS biosynthesis
MIPAYLINLDREVDRLNSSIEESQGLDCKLIRISAIDLNTLSEDSALYVAAGVRAAWLSHMQCFKNFLESKNSFALILEDDFSIRNTDQFNKEVARVIESSPDIVQFGFLVPGIDTRIKIIISNVEESFFRAFSFISRSLNLNSRRRLRIRRLFGVPSGYVIDDFQPGAHCYLISRKAAEIILELNEPQFLSIDDFFTAFARMRSLRFFRIKKSISGQKPFTPWKGDRFRIV